MFLRLRDYFGIVKFIGVNSLRCFTLMVLTELVTSTKRKNSCFLFAPVMLIIAFVLVISIICTRFVSTAQAEKQANRIKIFISLKWVGATTLSPSFHEKLYLSKRGGPREKIASQVYHKRNTCKALPEYVPRSRFLINRG